MHETFANVVGDDAEAARTIGIPTVGAVDAPANWTALRQGRLIVATTVGVFQSADADGGAYEVLGSGLVGVLSATPNVKQQRLRAKCLSRSRLNAGRLSLLRFALSMRDS